MNKKSILLITLFSIISVFSFAREFTLERKLNTSVLSYDKKVYKENGKVTLYVKEFTNEADGSRLGFAYSIESDSKESPVKPELINDFNSENEGGWLIYYQKGESFYIGEIWKSDYYYTVTDRTCFYEFDKAEGYNLYFMSCYLKAVNKTLTRGNDILYTENHKYWWDENKIVFTLRLSDFSDYKKYAQSKGNSAPYPSFRICLLNDSRNSGAKIAENLKKGMWKTHSRNADRGGSGLPQYGEITCWYDDIEEFCSWNPERKSLVIDYAQVISSSSSSF